MLALTLLQEKLNITDGFIASALWHANKSLTKNQTNMLTQVLACHQNL